MSDRIGPFGAKSIEVAARQLDRAYDRHEMTLEAVAYDVLSAAVGALDREALVEKARAVWREVAYAAPRRWENALADRRDAEAVIEALFPTEGATERIWRCPGCGSSYTADVGECGQRKPFECRERVVLVPTEGEATE
jgi:hypothetical protein